MALPGVALAATVKGKVAGAAKLLNPVWNEAKDPGLHRYSFREPSPTVRAEVYTLTGFLPKELAVVALGEGAKAKGTVAVTIAGGRTTPVTIVVPAGQAIQFTNADPFPHKLFDTGKKGLQPVETAPTKSRSWTPPGPGRYEIRDELAPSVRSWIVVEPRAVAVAYPNRKGEFAIDLEPGSYTLRGYFGGEPVGIEQTLNVTPTSEQVLQLPLVVGDDKGK